MAGKYADKAQSLRPTAGLMISGLHRPFHGQFCRHVRRRLLLHERREVLEVIGHIAQLESQTTPESDVVVDGLSQRFHRLRFEWCPGVGAATNHRFHPRMRHG
jgi:hypothetical protein